MQRPPNPVVPVRGAGRPIPVVVRALVPLVLAASGLLAACASGGAAPHFPGSALPRSGDDRPAASSTVSAIVGTALDLQGTPYRFGGKDPEAFDCSGLVAYVFGQHGIDLPHGVRAQWDIGAKVPRGQISSGDLVFFVTSGRTVSHVGIAIDHTSFIHAPNSTAVVRLDRLDDAYWGARLAGARRIVGEMAAVGL